MNIQTLQVFLDLVRTRSFSQTAKKHFRTQPAISISMRRLEEELGLKLIERRGREPRLTSAGEVLKDRMIDILRLTEDLKFQASLLAKQPRGRVKIAAIHSIGLYELGETIKRLIRKHRDIRMDLRYESFRRIYQLVEEGEVDFGVVAYPVESHIIEVLPLPEDEMVLVSSPSQKFKRGKSLRLNALDGLDYVAFSDDTPTRSAIDDILAREGIQVAIRFESDNIETLKKAIEVGVGVSILPLKTIEKDGRGRFVIHRIHGLKLRRPIGIIKLKKYPLKQAANFLAEELLTQLDR